MRGFPEAGVLTASQTGESPPFPQPCPSKAIPMNLGFWNFYTFYNSNKMFEGVSAHGAGDDASYGTMKLAQRLRGLGHQVNTLDLAEGELDAAVFFDHPTFLNPHFRRLRKTQTKLYLFLMENEVNRPDNYWKRNHRDFEKVFTWHPEWVDNRKYFQIFHTMKIPADFRVDLAAKNKFCVAVSSQKYSTHKKALYKDRFGIIRWFEREHPGQFDLYGQRWDRFYFSNSLWRLNMFLAKFYSKFPNHFQTRPFPSHRGPVASKREVMRFYKFAVVYENAVFPGYLTEKIFDAFFAGCVPLYLGAPDVLKYIPPETFVDRRDFANNEELYRYISGMSESEYLGKIKAIEEFVNGERIKPFSADRFIDTIVSEVVHA
jgi:alpha(1,3/1,4) fucosyltransferase